MSEPEHLLEATRWLRYAREDLGAATAMAADPSFAPRHVCLLAEQAAEKALKAALIYLQRDFPYHHDLDALRTLLPGGWEIKSGYEYLSDLADWAVESRYPGDWPEATTIEANEALNSLLEGSGVPALVV